MIDLPIFFPLLSVYKDNTIPCSITYNAVDHSDNLKPDAFGGKNGYLADNYKGQNEISSKLKPIYVFGRQMTDSGRNFKLTSGKDNNLGSLVLSNIAPENDTIIGSYNISLSNDLSTDYSGVEKYIDITSL